MDEKPLDLATIPGLIEQIPQLLSTLDVTDSDQISAIRFHTMFEQQVRRNPMATALFSAEQGKSITYGELNETSNRLAHCEWRRRFRRKIR
jgi:non-ribosomal peptide synthetase component F